MRTIYIYDGTFEGLLTAVFEAFFHHSDPMDIVKASNYQEDLLSLPVDIITDPKKSDRVAAGISSKLGNTVLENCYYTYLSELPGCGKMVYEYVKLGFSVGRNLNRYLTDDRVKKVLDAVRIVQVETHRLQGLLRFSLVASDTYFAAIEPLYNILELLAPHFAKRLSDQKWIIYDAGRKLAALYDLKDWQLHSGMELQHLAEGVGPDSAFKDLWRLYYRSISVEGRENPRLQKSFMPVRYWKYLTERQL